MAEEILITNRPTEQISLRQWRDSDLEAYAEMNADPEVMRFYPSVPTYEESAASLNRQRGFIEQRGWGLWVVDVDGTFAGFTGLAVPTFDATFMPCVEIGWRLRRQYWGRSIAYRAALQALDYGFRVLRLPEIVSFTATVNVRSFRLMKRLDFVRDTQNDFDHPAIPEGHELRRHLLHRKSRSSRQSK